MDKATIQRMLEVFSYREYLNASNLTRLWYYGLLDKITGSKVTGIDSKQEYTITDIGYHADHNGRFNPSYCEGYIVTKNGIVHLDLLDI